MKLYEFESFPNPRRVRMFLAEKGVSVPRVQVDVPGGDHRREAFLRKNPYGAVPTLELDDGACISETVAICRFFEESHPEPALMGSTAQERAEVEMWQRRIEQTLMETVAAYFHHATQGLGEPDRYRNREWGEKSRENVIDAMRRLDERLGDVHFVAGGRFSIADITALCAIDFAKAVGIEVPQGLQNLERWYAEIASRPSAAA